MKDYSVHRRNRDSIIRNLSFVSILLLSPALLAQFRTFETQQLRLVYRDKNHRYLLPHLARCFESSFSVHCQLFDYAPSEKVVIFVNDFADDGRAGATAVPRNYLYLSIAPFDHVYETSPTNERMSWLMHHELAHIFAVDKPSGSDRTARRLLSGKVVHRLFDRSKPTASRSGSLLQSNPFAGQGNPDLALSDFNRALELNSNLADVYVNRGQAYAQKGDFVRALADFGQAIQRNPKDVLAYYCRGFAHMLNGDNENAIADFKKTRSLTNDPNMLKQTIQQMEKLGAK